MLFFICNFISKRLSVGAIINIVILSYAESVTLETSGCFLLKVVDKNIATEEMVSVFSITVVIEILVDFNLRTKKNLLLVVI